MERKTGTVLYALAKDFLLQNTERSDARSTLENRLSPEYGLGDIRQIEQVWRRMVVSLSNAERKSKVVGDPSQFEDILCDFSPNRFLEENDHFKDQDKIEVLLNKLEKRRGLKISRQQRGIWPQYTRGLITSAKFTSQFDSSHAFFEWAESFSHDRKSHPGLPLIISQEVHGMGYTLACDFLKEIGFINYAKPDVHVRAVLKGVGLVSEKVSPYALQKKIRILADQAETTPFVLDKLIWLTGSDDWFTKSDVKLMGGARQKRALFIEFVNQNGLPDFIER